MSLTPAGIEPATFRIVAQRLNHCATAVSHRVRLYLVKITKFSIECGTEIFLFDAINDRSMYIHLHWGQTKKTIKLIFSSNLRAELLRNVEKAKEFVQFGVDIYHKTVIRKSFST